MDNPTLRLERRDPAKRMLRFYALQVMPNLFGEWGLLRTWGRIGRQGQMRTEWFETKREAEEALRALETAKRKRGYRENHPSKKRVQNNGKESVQFNLKI